VLRGGFVKSLFRTLTVFLALLALLACGKKEDKAGAPAGEQQGVGAKKEAVVKVPDSVKGKWRAVKVSVLDKTTNKDTVILIPVGQEVKVPDTSLSIAVEVFLPHFTIDGTALTSQSNEPKNPAAQIRILDNGKEIHRGWLYSLYPSTHAFQHPRYGFTLVDFIPAGH
jgi:hypothetical protein